MYTLHLQSWIIENTAGRLVSDYYRWPPEGSVLHKLHTQEKHHTNDKNDLWGRIIEQVFTKN